MRTLKTLGLVGMLLAAMVLCAGADCNVNVSGLMSGYGGSGYYYQPAPVVYYDDPYYYSDCWDCKKIN